MTILARAPKNLKDRLDFLRRLLTQPHLDEHINHYDRTLLLEEAEMLHKTAEEKNTLKEKNRG